MRGVSPLWRWRVSDPEALPAHTDHCYTEEARLAAWAAVEGWTVRRDRGGYHLVTPDGSDASPFQVGADVRSAFHAFMRGR